MTVPGSGGFCKRSLDPGNLTASKGTGAPRAWRARRSGRTRHRVRPSAHRAPRAPRALNRAGTPETPPPGGRLRPTPSAQGAGTGPPRPGAPRTVAPETRRPAPARRRSPGRGGHAPGVGTERPASFRMDRLGHYTQAPHIQCNLHPSLIVPGRLTQFARTLDIMRRHLSSIFDTRSHISRSMTGWTCYTFCTSLVRNIGQRTP